MDHNSKITSTTYHRINHAFERAVNLLRDNLQYLADQDKVSDKFLSLHNRIIESIIDYQKQTEAIITALEEEVIKASQGRLKEIRRLEEIKEGFEALCIIHGITDFPMWMGRGKRSLVSQAIEDYKEKRLTLPVVLKDHFDRLPEHERQVLKKILYSGYDKEVAETKQQIEKLNAQKKQ